jgi:predicted nuclease with RNAse H fold
LRTLGIDLASQPKRTAAVVVEWDDSGGQGHVTSVHRPVGDEEIVALVSEDPDVRVGIDAPFGWPTAFVDGIWRWERAGRWQPDLGLRDLRYRLTDLAVREAAGRFPLSVSTDRIGIPTFRCVQLLTRLAGPDGTVDRVGGRIIEVYPAAALRRWGLPSGGYKDDTTGALGVRAQLVADLARIGRLDVPSDIRSACLESDHCLDAVICALVARAAGVGLTDVPPPDRLETILREGWIEVPSADSLGLLASDSGRLERF